MWLNEKKYLQEARLQPKIKVAVYGDDNLAGKSRRKSTDRKDIIYTSPLVIIGDTSAGSDDEISEMTFKQRRCSLRWRGLPV